MNFLLLPYLRSWTKGLNNSGSKTGSGEFTVNSQNRKTEIGGWRKILCPREELCLQFGSVLVCFFVLFFGGIIEQNLAKFVKLLLLPQLTSIIAAKNMLEYYNWVTLVELMHWHDCDTVCFTRTKKKKKRNPNLCFMQLNSSAWRIKYCASMLNLFLCAIEHKSSEYSPPFIFCVLLTVA